MYNNLGEFANVLEICERHFLSLCTTVISLSGGLKDGEGRRGREGEKLGMLDRNARQMKRNSCFSKDREVATLFSYVTQLLRKVRNSDKAKNSKRNNFCRKRIATLLSDCLLNRAEFCRVMRSFSFSPSSF